MWVWDTRQQGQLSSRSGNGFSEDYFYDGFSRLSRQIVTTAGLSGGEFIYTYDNFSRPETVKYPNGFKIERNYHADGYQVQTRDVTVAGSPKVLWALGNTIDTRGAFNNQLWGNGVVTQTGFDATSGRLTSIKSGRLSSNNSITNLYGDIQDITYTFDSLGNLRSRMTTRNDNNGLERESVTEAYGYDKLNRVTTSTTSGLFRRTQTFQYDNGGLGNLINRSDVLTGTSINNDVGELKYEQVRNAGIHAVTSAGGVNYSYDNYGNMIARGSESIIYDTFNKPTRIAGASITDFYYGPDHKLYKEISGTKTTYKLAGGLYEVIVDGTNTTQKSYVDGVILNNRTLTNGTQSANDTHYLHTDHLGSVEATTNALGQFVNRMSFGAWGERQKSDWRPGTPTESFLTSNGFTGHDQLDNHKLVHMGGRVYDPNLGRFLSADLFIQSPYDSQNYNRYSYAGNNPLSYTDPTGYKRSNLDPAQRDFAFAMQQAIYAQVNPYPNCGTGARGACIGDDGFLNLPVRRGNDGPTEDDRARMRQLNHDSYVSYHRASLDYASFGSRLPSFSPSTVNFVVGLGNSVSFGAGAYISEWANGAGSFDRDSDAFSYGGYAGIIGGGLGGIGKGALNYARTTFVGTAQRTGTLGHSFVSKLIGYSAAINNPNIVRVGFDVGYKRALEGLATTAYKYGPRPDVLLGYKNGFVKAIEVASRSDDISALYARNYNKIKLENLNGSVRVSQWAARIDSLFRGL